MPAASVPPRTRIAIVAHDNKKPELLACVAPGRPADSCPRSSGLPVHRFLSGPLGRPADRRVYRRTEARRARVLLGPLEAQPHDPDVKALLRVAVVWNIPVACNEATAGHLLTSPLMASEYSRTVPV